MHPSAPLRRMLAAALLFTAASGMALAQTTGTMAPTGPAPASPTQKLPLGDRFKTAAAATAHCPGDTVVWSTFSKSKSFHLAGSKHYGTTKHGGYVCEHDALAFGYHAAKN